MEGTSQDLGALKEEFVHLMRLIHREQFHSAWTPKNLSKPEMRALMCIWIARRKSISKARSLGERLSVGSDRANRRRACLGRRGAVCQVALFQ